MNYRVLCYSCNAIAIENTRDAALLWASIHLYICPLFNLYGAVHLHGEKLELTAGGTG